jgi:hypothetical protein
MKTLLRTTTALVAFAAVTSASAADLPVKAPPTAAVAYSDGFYIWVDGSYQSVALPKFDLGWRRFDAFGASSTATESYDPKATGAGFSGAIGHIFPNGTFSPLFGSNVRIELGASYVKADAAQSGTGAAVAGSSNAIALVGRPIASEGWGCGPPCFTTSTLGTNYAAWQLNVKAASDFKSGVVTITPSMAVFGGDTRDHQNFLQLLFLDGGSVLADTYSARSNLDWFDWGAKLGVNGRIDVTNWLAVDLGGTIGFAWRDASLSANDIVADLFFPIPHNTSSVNISSNTTPLLANAEASVVIKPFAAMAIRAFAGLNYDSQVPGISAPNFTGSVLPTPSTPSGIKFSPETSYYVGGGVIIPFGGSVAAKY